MTSRFSRRKKGPKLGKIGLNLGFLIIFSTLFESLHFSDFAYYDRQAWYLTGTGGPVAEKKFLAQIWAFLGPNLAQNRVFGNYLDLDPYDLSDIAHSG